jgi:hypothetical protein
LKILEQEITYLKKHYEIEFGILKNENNILKNELISFQQQRRQQHHSFTPNNRNYCSPIRGIRDFEGDDSQMLNNSALFSPFVAGQ